MPVYFMYISFTVGMSVVWGMMIHRYDPGHGMRFERKRAACLAGFLILFGIVSFREQDIPRGMFICFLAAYLATASYSDSQTREVYRFQKYPAALAGILYLVNAEPTRYQVVSLCLYLFLQAVVLGKCYGRADVHAFMITSLFFVDNSVTGSILICGLMHVGESLLLLLLVRYRDMDWKRGRLKEPAAFLPYLSATALILMLL